MNPPHASSGSPTLRISELVGATSSLLDHSTAAHSPQPESPADSATLALTAPEPLPEADRPFLTLLQGLLDAVLRLMGAQAAALRFITEQRAELKLQVSLGLPPEVVLLESGVPLDCEVCSAALRDGNLYLMQGEGCTACGLNSGAADSLPNKVVAVPLSYRGRTIGLLNLFFARLPELDAVQQHLLQTYAGIIGMALENARQSQEQQRAQLMAERQAIANEIHDSLSQTLFYGRLRMSVLQEAVNSDQGATAKDCINDLSDALDEAQESVRDLITHFRSPMDPQGLEHALEEQVKRLKTITGMDIVLHFPQVKPQLTLEQELQIFHILREALNNAVSHSQANRVSLTLLVSAERLNYEIADDGIGMKEPSSPFGHFGLTIMRERARRIGAEFQVLTAPGQGTRIVLSTPVG